MRADFGAPPLGWWALLPPNSDPVVRLCASVAGLEDEEFLQEMLRTARPMQLPIGRVTRRLTTQVHSAPRTVINIGQRPIINVAPVYSKISTIDLALLQLLQSRFTLEDPRYKFLKKHRRESLKWVQLSASLRNANLHAQDGKVEFLKRKGGDGVFLTGAPSWIYASS